MKKIRQSQTRPINPQQQQQQQQQSANALHSGLNTHSAHLKKIRSSQGGPLSMHKSHHLGPSSSSSTSISSTLSSSSLTANSSSAVAALNQTPAHAHQRPKVNTLWNPPQQVRHPTPVGIAPPHVGNLSRQPITTPPNVVQAMMGNLSSSSQSLLMNQINAAAAAAVRRPHTSLNNNNPTSNNNNILNQTNNNNKMAAQLLLQSKQRSNLKPSLQKQLENTLLPQSTKHGHSSGMSFNSANLSNSNRRMVGVTSPHVGNLSRQPITTPPNVVQDMRGGQQSLLMNSNSLTNLVRNNRNTQQIQHQSSFNKSQGASGTGSSGSSSMLLQKRTAAKAAIQRQLEQTLMQLPPKQLHLGIDFIPNANNIEFVYYVGLEACVDYLTNTKNPIDLQPLEKPLECSTCGTDFTPAWSWKRSNAVCESCVSNHVKKSIKNSQASRIKSVLAKAAKQEQEMDQRILAEANNPTSQSSPTTSSTLSHQHQPHSLLQPTQSHHLHSQQRSSPQVWPRLNQSSPLNVVSSNNSNNRGATTTTTPATVQPVLNANPLASLQPAIASLLQMNPQISTLASLMTANTPSTTNNANTTNTNQFAQVAALLMNQLTMNMFKR